IEIFKVDERTISRIDNLEGVPYLYSRLNIFIEEASVEAFIYVITNREPTGDLIEDGIFRLK
ncbi:MAG: gamma-glutamylcyclotransferase, partial [Candidatus Thorarchaeota archaeon]